MIPLYKEIEWRDPASIARLFAEEQGTLFLDSASFSEASRYSFIGIHPFLTLTSKNGKMTLNLNEFQGNPWDALAEQLALFQFKVIPHLPPFQGGVAGFFAYDLYQHLENIKGQQQDDIAFPDMALGFYDLVIAFDHADQKAWIFSSGFPLQDKTLRLERANNRLQWLLEKLACVTSDIENKKRFSTKITSNFTKPNYCAAVQTVKNYILAGDIFQANISQRFEARLPTDFTPFFLYERLRKINPAPFAAYFKMDDVVIASASPERFLELRNQLVETRPIKGTRPRGKTAEEDEKLMKELLVSEKDHAENVMIVDLLRNDLSKVCEAHSVKVTQLCGLETFATVHHLVSIVTGKLQFNSTAIDLLRATFPGGSITGAPKIRAMEIIAEIEPTKRGPYCGSMGYIGFNGDMDTSITIRTFAIKNNKILFQAGGGIVLDSDPLMEYEETLTKASALQRVLTDDFINR
jgi:para-aminobenzoate synthetase component 1